MLRLFVFIIGLIVAHHLLMQVYPPYRDRMRSLDRKVTWFAVLLVLYLVMNFAYIMYSRLFR
jgi:hypothetical protein